MKILMTSGGTRVPIDRVRHMRPATPFPYDDDDIRNMSSGTFGARIATELLRMGQEVIFLRAVESKSPFTRTVNFAKESPQRAFEKWLDANNLYLQYGKNYREYEYKTFDDYAALLEKLLREEQPHATVLAAAVSDYGVDNYVDGKIRTSGDLAIHLKPLPKLIGKVKEWCPETRLIGFKLMVDSTDEQLIEAAKKSAVENHCEFVVANDLRDIVNAQHRVILVTRHSAEKYGPIPQLAADDPNYLARKVAREVVGAAMSVI